MCPGCWLFSPHTLYLLPPSSTPPLHVCTHLSRPPPAARTHSARPPAPAGQSSVARPPPPSPTTLSARASHLARVRALFFPPYFPHPPRGRRRPHTRAGPGQRAGAGVHGARARDRLRVGVRGGGAGAARAVCSRTRAPLPRRELGEEEEGRELKEQESPFPDPPFFTRHPPHG